MPAFEIDGKARRRDTQADCEPVLISRMHLDSIGALGVLNVWIRRELRLDLLHGVHASVLTRASSPESAAQEVAMLAADPLRYQLRSLAATSREHPNPAADAAVSRTAHDYASRVPGRQRAA